MRRDIYIVNQKWLITRHQGNMRVKLAIMTITEDQLGKAEGSSLNKIFSHLFIDPLLNFFLIVHLTFYQIVSIYGIPAEWR